MPDSNVLLLADLLEVTAEIEAALEASDDWSQVDRDHPGQYRHDIVADEAAVAGLIRRGYGVLSEESGRSGDPDAPLVVVDPVDGSTNASLGIPHWVVSLCALDVDGPRASVVKNPMSGETFTAIRGEGARLDGRALSAQAPSSVARAVIGVTGTPPRKLPVWQYRAMGAAALDLCYVAAGRFHGFVSPSGLSVWDYLGALLVCTEAGADVLDVAGRDLVVTEGDLRRRPVAGSTPELAQALVEAMR